MSPQRAGSCADELDVGDQLTLADGGTCRIDWIDRSHAAADQPIIVYNFEVEQHHTYFVGRAAIWVHNDDYSDLLSKVSRAKTPESAADAAAKELGNLIRDKGAKAEDVLSDATKLKAELFPDAADFNPKSIAAKAEELAASNAPSNLAKLQIDPSYFPKGVTTNTQFGKQVMKRGTGAEGAQTAIRNLTREQLVQGGVTREIAQKWQAFYANEFARNPANLTAKFREELMRKATDLLGH